MAEAILLSHLPNGTIIYDKNGQPKYKKVDWLEASFSPKEECYKQCGYSVPVFIFSRNEYQLVPDRFILLVSEIGLLRMDGEQAVFV